MSKFKYDNDFLHFRIQLIQFIMKKSLMLTFISVCLGACQSVIEIPQPGDKPPLTVNAIFTPDSLMKVEVYNSVSFFDSVMPFQPVANALVTVKATNGNTISFHFENNLYTANVRPSSGETYKLIVTAPGYLGQVTAFTTIPGKKPDFNIEDYGTDTSDTRNKNNLYIDLSVNDPAGQVNYFSISAEIQQLVYKPDTNSIAGKWMIADTVETGSYIRVESHGDQEFSPDDSYDPTTQIFIDPRDNFRIWIQNDRYIPDLPQNLSFKIIIREIDNDYYEYLRSAYSNLNNSSAVFTGPVRVYSNISGGLGIFSNYTENSIIKNYPDIKLIEDYFGNK